jgi:hypothetical protein
MSKHAKIVLILLLLAAAISAGFLLLRQKEENHPVARITLDGEVWEEIDLSAVKAPYTLQVEGKDGLTNTILVEPGQIQVQRADCPDQICVHQGVISDGTVPIVCLPNKLIIQIVGGGDGLDAATG